MHFQFTHPWWLLILPIALGWVGWWAWKTDVQISPWRRWAVLGLRSAIVTMLVLALAGSQWLRPQEGMNVIYLLDRSESIPAQQQEAALQYVNRTVTHKETFDRAGLVVFGTDAGIESSVNQALDVEKVQAVVGTDRTDIGAGIRLGTAAFPEVGQKRLVLLSDGNENLGDAMAALRAAESLGVSLDVVPLGKVRSGDASVQKLSLPSQLKKGQTFEVKIFAQADQARAATVRLFRNDQLLGEQKVELSAGKNLFSFPQTLTEPGFYNYDVQLDAAGDSIPQNNRAIAFANVRGDPRVLVVSSEPEADASLVAALRSARWEVRVGGLQALPGTLAELQSYDTIFLSNIGAGDLGRDEMQLIESAVRDFGVGLVCVGGDQAYGAGGYRGTPLEAALPVSMEIDSKKVLPKGALVLVVHATEFPNGNQWARDIAFAALTALGPQDEMGIVLWDGNNRWLFPLAKVGDKREMGRLITGMQPGDMPNFQTVMEMAHDGLRKSTANLKHMVVFSDGDPGAPSDELLNSIVNDRITISTVMIGGHVVPDRMIMMADRGKGRFYEVNAPGQLPQIFIKEAAIILKSAIIEHPFKPQWAGGSELVKGIGPGEFPLLRGYVATSPKPRAELPLATDKGDPLLAHWQFGLGRAVAFTSDAKAKWAADWMGWPKYRQFWMQIAQWSLRRTENTEFTTEISVDKGVGQLNVEAVDEQGNYRNFLDLQTAIVSPKGERQTVRLEQTSPGRYEARFPTREVGAYLLNLMEMQKGQLRGSQVLGTSVNYSPEFDDRGPNLNLLERLAALGRGRTLSLANPSANSFDHDRLKTFQPRDLWEWLLKLAIILFPMDVGVRRIQIDRAEWRRAMQYPRRWLLFWRGVPRPVEADVSLAALLARRDQVRVKTVVASMPEPSLSPARPVDTKARGAAEILPKPVKPPGERVEEPAKPLEETAGGASTASRLLEAKRRSQRWKR
ncbi:MAG: VWA domain-containing protein [Candidatus Omnitrophica bacterium]|nr:VWA domain-containing protein [Candidatus Omnitrophota bacterium]